jgi:hypothetical protein
MRALLLVSLITAAAAAPPARITLVAAAPGYPGTTAEAQPNMDALAAAIARGAGLPEGAVAAVYASTEEDGLARLRRPDAALALVPLPFARKHGKALGLRPRLLVAQQGVGTTEVWTLVARKGRVASPASLAGLTVASIAGYAPDFVRGALGPWGRIPAGAKIVATGQVLSYLRKAAAGEDVALLLDGAQSAALATLPFAADLEVVARSAPLPAAYLATVGSRVPPARWTALEKALLGLASDPRAAAALEGVRMKGFAPLDAAAEAAAKAIGAAGAAR